MIKMLLRNSSFRRRPEAISTEPLDSGLRRNDDLCLTVLRPKDGHV